MSSAKVTNKKTTQLLWLLRKFPLKFLAFHREKRIHSYLCKVKWAIGLFGKSFRSANNNTWDRIEVKFIKFNSLWPLERPGIILEARCMGSPSSHREKSVPPHWRLRFASQTSRKWSVFEAHHHWGRKMGCIQQRQTQEVMEQKRWTGSNHFQSRYSPKKVMLSVWWDFKGIVFFELLPDNTTINSEVYCHQLGKLNDALQQKRSELINRKGVVFHQNKARPHTSLVTRQKLLQLEWDTMLHPPYSPDLAPSDYYLFRSLQNFLDGKTFTSNEEVKNLLDQFFASKDQKFYERGIMLLPERWQKVLDQNGQYII